MGKQTRYYRRNRRNKSRRRNKRRTRYRRSRRQKGGNLQFGSNIPRGLGYSFVHEPLQPNNLGLANPPPFTSYNRCKKY